MSGEAFRNPLVTDRGKRAADIVNLHLAVDSTELLRQRWVAIRLSDGGSDGQVYDTRADAIRHQLHELWCAYMFLPPTGTTPQKMEKFLQYVEGLYSRGLRPAQNRDPNPHLYVPNREEIR